MDFINNFIKFFPLFYPFAFTAFETDRSHAYSYCYFIVIVVILFVFVIKLNGIFSNIVGLGNIMCW